MHLSYRDTSLFIPSSYQTAARLFNQSVTACCVMHSIGTHLTILPTVRTWHHRTFTSFRRWRSTFLVKRFTDDEDVSWTGWIAGRPSGTRREQINWCHGTTSVSMSKVTIWRSRWRCVIKPAYSFSFLLSINIFVQQNVLYFLNDLHIFQHFKRYTKNVYCFHK